MSIQYAYLNLVPLINKFESNAQFSEICLYHAYEPPKLGGKETLPQTMKTLMEDDERYINNILSNQASVFRSLLKSDTNVKTNVRRNRPVQGIKNKIKKYKPDIVIMTTQQHMGISKYINSSHALKLMNQVKVPILIMPQDYKFKKDIKLNFLIQNLTIMNWQRSCLRGSRRSLTI